MNVDIKQLLVEVQEGRISPDEALGRIRSAPFTDLGYAKPDLHRRLRQGVGEVVYGEGKTPGQISGIMDALRAGGEERILITRLSARAAEELRRLQTFRYFPEARLGIAGELPAPDGLGRIVVAAAGTSDLPVAEEAALTAEYLGNEVLRLYDVGVAGLHRLLSYLEQLQQAAAVIAVAGMEGALASVIGGLVDCPVIAVPTSVGYGASFAGLSALLAMLNSCAAGVGVVNIDNGFGAAYLASKINHMEAKK